MLDWIDAGVTLPDDGRTVAVRLRGRELLVCSVGGSPYVVDDRCSHGSTPLSGGRLCGFVLECPLHGGKIDVRDGSPAAPPVRRPVRSWPVRVAAGGAIEIGFARQAGAPG